jgi:hypothetical protein
MNWMTLEKIEKKFDLFGIQTHPISLNPHGLRANRTSPKLRANRASTKVGKKGKRRNELEQHRRIFGSMRACISIVL